MHVCVYQTQEQVHGITWNKSWFQVDDGAVQKYWSIQIIGRRRPHVTKDIQFVPRQTTFNRTLFARDISAIEKVVSRFSKENYKTAAVGQTLFKNEYTLHKTNHVSQY